MGRSALAFLLAAGVTAACSSGGNANEVAMNDAPAFVPSEVTVEAGETLVFVNEGGQPHTVTAYQDSLPEGGDFFSSGNLASEDAARENPSPAFITEGESFELALEAPGTYRFFCIPHEQQGMTGTITVEG